MARVGSTVNFLAMAPIYNWVASFTEDGYTTLGVSLFIGKYLMQLIEIIFIYYSFKLKLFFKIADKISMPRAVSCGH